MGDLADHYMTLRLRSGDISKPTRNRMRTVLWSFADTFGGRDVAKLSRRDIDRWMATRGHLSPGTRRLDWSILRVFVRWLVERRHVRVDPFIGMKAPRVPRRVPRALSVDECAALEAVLPDKRAWAIYALMRWIGLRRAEVVALQVGSWDQRAGIITFAGKGGHERTEPVPPWVARILNDYLHECGAKAGPMIRTLDGSRGVSLTHVSKMMKRWMEAAGIKRAAYDGRGPHSLRHTIASELVEAGADIVTVQALLGHQSLTSTQVYLRRAHAGRVLSAMELAYAA